MDKASDFIEIYANTFIKALKLGQDTSHYNLAIDLSNNQDNQNISILKNLAFTISKWIIAQNHKNTISIQIFSSEVKTLIDEPESDLIKIKNSFWSIMFEIILKLECGPLSGDVNPSNIITHNIENMKNRAQKNKNLIIITHQSLKFDENQVEEFYDIAKPFIIFYGNKLVPENLSKWCNENSFSPSNSLLFNEYDHLIAFSDYLLEEPRNSVTFSFKYIGTTTTFLQFEEKETKSQTYEIEWKPSTENQSIQTSSTTWNHFIITNLTPNTEYTVRARVRTDLGHVSKWSNTSSFTTLKSHELENILRDTSNLEKKSLEISESIRSHTDKLKELKIPGINLMVIGRRGVGKSSLITSINLIFNKVFDETTAPSGSSPEGTTDTYNSIRILDFLRIWDTIGIDSPHVDLVDWLPSCLDGELAEGTKLGDSVYKRQEGTIKTKIHGAIVMVDDVVLRDTLLLKKTLDVITILTKRFIPFSIVLAKADQVHKLPLKPEDLLSHHDILNTIRTVAQALKYSHKEPLIYPVINYQYKPESNFLQFDFLMLKLLRELITNATKSVISNKKIVEVITTTKQKIGNLSLDSLNIKLEAVREMIHKMADDQFMFTRQDNFKISKKEEASLMVDDILQQSGDVLFIKINTHVKLD